MSGSSRKVFSPSEGRPCESMCLRTTTQEGASEVVKSVEFSFMTDEDVRKHSLAEVINPKFLTPMERRVRGGLYDTRMGPLVDEIGCSSCGLSRVDCPGHCGHIELAYPIYHPLLFSLLHKFLQMACFSCKRFMAEQEEVKRCVSQLKLIIKGDIVAAKQLSSENIFSSTECEDSVLGKQRWTSLHYAEVTNVMNKFLTLQSKKCENCGAENPKLENPMFGWLRLTDMIESATRANIIQGLKVKRKDVAEEEREEILEILKDDPRQKDRRDLLPTEVKELLKELWKNEDEFFSFIGNLWQSGSAKNDHHSMFFLETILVPPTKFRPPTKEGDSVIDHPQTIGLSRVLQSNITLGNAHAKKLDLSKIISRWMELQESVNVLFDSKTATVQSQREGSGICQLLEKQEGLFRQKMMGKRVNHACRSVICPDPYIPVNEIGIPLSFALKMTYPERVTQWNSEKLREAIINGPVHPGARYYIDKNNQWLIAEPRKNRTVLARKFLSSGRTVTEAEKTSNDNREGKVVCRHLQDGDVVLVNHQPTLHKPSIMAHIVRILKGEKTLRLHYANCSAYNANYGGDEMNVHFPQDEIARAEAYNIVNANNQYARPSNGGPLRALVQDHIVSSALLTKRDTFLDKAEYYQLLFSSGLTDWVLSSSSGRSGKKVIESAYDAEPLRVMPAILKPIPLWTGKQVITAVLNQITKGHPPFNLEKATKLPFDFFKCRSEKVNGMGDIDESWKWDLNEDKLVIKENEFVCGVIDKAQFADYGLVHTVHELYGSIASGNLLSVFSRIFTVFLQMHGFTCGVDDLVISKDMDEERTKQLQEFEQVSERVLQKTFGVAVDVQTDKQDMISRIERMIYEDGESALASLDKSIVNELNQCSSNGVLSNLLSDGLLKTPGKNCMSLMTSSGAKGSKVNFQQISSHLGQQVLEGKRVPRMVSGKTLPCFHPWDLSPRAGGFISDRFLSGLRPQEYYFHCMAGREGLIDTTVKTSSSGYLLRRLIKSLESLKVNYDYTVRDADGSIIQFQYGEDGVDVQRSSFIGKFKELISNRDVILPRCSEDMLSGSNSYITDLPSSLKNGAEKFVETKSEEKKEELLKLVKSKFFASLAQPGEPVGVLAAQSVGEPSTQMTLNPFHLGGHGEMNVTLGIPRLEEILMTSAVDIETPIMTCPLRKDKTKDDANDITNKLRNITVADIIESMDVLIKPLTTYESEVCSIHKLKINLYTPEHTDITYEDCQDIMKGAFLRKLEDEIDIHMKTNNEVSVSGMQTEDDEGEGSNIDDLSEDEIYYDNKNEPSSFSVEDPKMDNKEILGTEVDDPYLRDRCISVQDQGRIFEVHFKFSLEEPHILLSQIAQKIAEKVYIQNSGKIKRCTVTNCGDPQVIYYGDSPKERKEVSNDEKKAKPALHVSGVDIPSFWEFQDKLDVRYLYSNSIHDMLNYFGVEAARETIIRELNHVFKACGSSVSIRHLYLIADYMTSSGGCCPLGSTGRIAESTSPFSRMTHETATRFIVQAATYGEKDNLETPSARICLGLPALSGTGCFDLVQKFESGG